MPARISRGLSRNGRRGVAVVPAAPVERLGLIDVTVAGIRGSLLHVQEFVQLTHEFAHVAELTVHGREPHVRDLVQLLQLLHDETADFGRRDFFLGALLQRGLHAVGDGLERRHAHGPLLARFQQARDQLLPLEPFARAIFLDHHVRDLVDPFVAGESFAALEALTPPSNRFTCLGFARVDDFVSQMAAVRTLHDFAPCGWGSASAASRRIPERFKPTWAANSNPSSKAGPIENKWATIAAPTAAPSGAPKNNVAPSRKASWNPPMAPGVGTATPITSRAIIRNVPVNGISRRKAIATDHKPVAIDSQSGNDHSSATSRRRGRRTAPSPRANFSATRPIRPASADGTTCSRRAIARPMRAGSPASTNITMSATSAPASAVTPAHLTAANVVGFETPTPSSKKKINAPSSATTVRTSSTRSRMIVAKAPVAVMFS